MTNLDFINNHLKDNYISLYEEEIQGVIDALSDLFDKKARDIESKEPYATKSIRNNEHVSHELFELNLEEEV